MKINLDSPVIVFLTTVADFMMLNILFILCCAPVITIGPAVSPEKRSLVFYYKGNVTLATE